MSTASGSPTNVSSAAESDALTNVARDHERRVAFLVTELSVRTPSEKLI